MKICNNLMTKMVMFVLVCGIVLLAGAPPVSAANVNIPDANLRARINKLLGANRAATAAVTEAEMKTLTRFLSRGEPTISNITGLEKATNLTELSLFGHSVSDISHLSGLTKLAYLDLRDNRISDISPLVSNTGLGRRGQFGRDVIWLTGNPLSYPSQYTHIPALQTRGARVYFIFSTPTTLKKVSGDARTTAGVNSLVVEVKDSASPAKPFAGVPVTFAVTGGGGTLSATSVATDTNGQAQVTLRPGTTGSNTVTATVTHAGRTLSVSFTSEVGVNIPDANLRRVINRALGASRAATAAVAGGEMMTLTSLVARSASISTLTGVEEATNLTTLDLVSNSISDISAVSGLTNLTTLKLGNNSITDLSSVSGLTNLTTLGLTSNSISDISHLSGLTNLTTLSLTSNSISSISAVSGLTNLTILNLGHNSISSISAVSGLTKLTTLRLGNNSISDISPLVSNTGLGTGDWVNLDANPLSYPSIYTHIPALKARGVKFSFTNRVPTTLTRVSGDAQTGTTGTALANPFVVEVKDGATPAKAFAGVPVTFAVTAGGGTLSAATAATDATGRAQVTLTLGTTGNQTVTATVTHADQTLTQTFTATVNNVPPTFTSAETFSVVENSTAVGTVVASDADTADNVTGYTITAGADSSKFAITNAGVLTFAAAPDYDNPGDALSATPANAAGNNQYIVVVTATSGTGARIQTATQTLTITVTDVPPPGKPAAPTVTVDSHTSVNVTWTAPTNTGTAINEYNVQYRAGTTGGFTDANYTGTATDTTLTGLAAGTSYQVQVRARSSEGKGPWSDASAATTTYQAEDVDSDGDVDIDDLVAVVSNFGRVPPGRNDVDKNGAVDAADIRAVFAAVLAAEAAAAPAHVMHNAKTLQDYVQQTKQRGIDANLRRGLAVLEELIEPFLIPDEFSLLHNYPNPFNPETWFPYQLATAAEVTFAIYSVNGTLVRTLSLGHQAAGVYRSKSRAAYWDGRNALGEPVASGIYFYTLTAGEFTATGKMLIRK